MKILRPYQKEAVDAIFKRAAFKRRGLNLPALVVLASGLGKTVIAAKTALLWLMKYSAARVLFLVHMNEAIDQAKASFVEEFENRKKHLAVLNGKKKPRADIIFSTFQTMRNRLDQFSPDEFGLIIVDEAHHGQAVTYRDVITYFRPKFLVGMTATPNRMDDQDIRTIFGNEVYKYGLAEALVEGKWLSAVDYRIMFDNIDILRLQNLVRRVRGGDRTVTREMIDNTIFLPERIEEVARLIKIEQQNSRKTIIFCRSLNHLRLVHAHFPEAKAYHSKISQRELAMRLADFRSGKLQTILVVDKFNEAIDIPDAELLVFLRSTSSEIVWKQQLGRGCRRAEGKEKVVVLDFVVNCKRFFSVQQFASEVVDAGKRRQLLLHLGLKVEFSQQAVALAELINFLETKFYSTWEEAAEAVRKIGAKSAVEYRRFCLRDPQLPYDPTHVYTSEWKSRGGWPGFLGTDRRRPQRSEKFLSYDDACRYVRALGIKSFDAYRQIYPNRPFLPSNPQVVYMSVWREKGGWPGFFGTGRRSRGNSSNFYTTYKQASRAARKRGIRTVSEYHKKYREDSRLPSAPDMVYKDDWVRLGSWSGFLGTNK